MKYKGFIFLLAVVMLSSCRKEIDKFERPAWLEGKIYTQLLTVPDIDSFLVCVERSGYDTILNTSGSYAVFAPDNQAFLAYVADKPYNSAWGMPIEEVRELVKYHVIQNPWSRKQLQILDVNGWIDINDPYNDEPWGYKRQTLLKDPNKKYFVDIDRDVVTIVDSVGATEARTVFNGTKKHVPIFFDEYMDIANLSSGDFQFFFDRPYEAGNIYYANAKLYPEDYFAENGFIYKLDQVVQPFRNAEQLLKRQLEGTSYSTFLNSIYLFPTFYENTVETFKQEGAELGLEVPTLYDVDYSSLVFDIHEEMTGRGDLVNVSTTIRYHYGMLAPTNAAMNDLINNVVTDNSGYPHWPSWTTVPENIKRIIVNAHMAPAPVYLDDLRNGFVNGEADSVFVDDEVIGERIYGSNATFYGLDEAIVPRAFSSVTGPVYLRPGFETFMHAIEYTNVLPAVKRRDANYAFFVLPDNFLMEDSSLFISRDPLRPRRLIVTSFDLSDERRREIRRGTTELTLQLLNQVGTWIPSGVPRKEFIENLAGNYIVYNSEIHPETGGPTVTGGLESVWGYQGDSAIAVTPVPLEEPTDNGIAYSTRGWLKFPTLRIYDALTGHSAFFGLLRQAGLIDEIFYDLNFLSESERFTIFVPTDSAIANVDTDTMSQEELQQFCKYHFVRGDLIFTDGNKPSVNYETLRLDESTTVFKNVYSTIDVRTGLDVISLYDGLGNHITDVVESGMATNLMTAVNLSNDDDLDNYVTNGVVHEIDTVLIKR